MRAVRVAFADRAHQVSCAESHFPSWGSVRSPNKSIHLKHTVGYDAVLEVTGHEILHSVESILIPVHFQYHLVRVTNQ